MVWQRFAVRRLCALCVTWAIAGAAGCATPIEIPFADATPSHGSDDAFRANPDAASPPPPTDAAPLFDGGVTMPDGFAAENDGAVPDGHAPDGELPDAHGPDGHAPDGELPDAHGPDAEVANG